MAQPLSNPVPARLQQLATRRAESPAKGAALHLSRLAKHLRASQEVMLSRCAGPRGGDFSLLLADYDRAVGHLRGLLTNLRELRRQHAGTPGPAAGEDPWFHPPYQPFLRASKQAVDAHLPPVFESMKRHRAVLKGQPYPTTNRRAA